MPAEQAREGQAVFANLGGQKEAQGALDRAAGDLWLT